VVDRFEDQKINDMNEFDLTVVYKHSKTANFQFGVRNLLDSEAPNDPDGGTGGAAVINTSLYDVNRRVIFAGYNQKF
jgi:outer membrane receptor protein involved in Fe transport